MIFVQKHRINFMPVQSWRKQTSRKVSRATFRLEDDGISAFHWQFLILGAQMLCFSLLSTREEPWILFCWSSVGEGNTNLRWSDGLIACWTCWALSALPICQKVSIWNAQRWARGQPEERGHLSQLPQPWEWSDSLNFGAELTHVCRFEQVHFDIQNIDVKLSISTRTPETCKAISQNM